MLRAAFFEDFKGWDTLLLWGNNEDMSYLNGALHNLRRDTTSSLIVEGGPGLTELRIEVAKAGEVSSVSGTADALGWSISPQTLDDVIHLVEPFITSAAGHQFVDVDGSPADQVMIAVNEYPDEFRRKVR